MAGNFNLGEMAPLTHAQNGRAQGRNVDLVTAAIIDRAMLDRRMGTVSDLFEKLGVESTEDALDALKKSQ